jgi:hypothetical protein
MFHGVHASAFFDYLVRFFFAEGMPIYKSPIFQRIKKKNTDRATMCSWLKNNHGAKDRANGPKWRKY